VRDFRVPFIAGAGSHAHLVRIREHTDTGKVHLAVSGRCFIHVFDRSKVYITAFDRAFH